MIKSVGVIPLLLVTSLSLSAHSVQILPDHQEPPAYKGDARNGEKLTSLINTVKELSDKEQKDLNCYVSLSGIETNISELTPSLNSMFIAQKKDVEKLAITIYNEQAVANHLNVGVAIISEKINELEKQCLPLQISTHKTNFDYLEFNTEFNVFKNWIEQEIGASELTKWKSDCQNLQKEYVETQFEVNANRERLQRLYKVIGTTTITSDSPSSWESLQLDEKVLDINKGNLETLRQASTGMECWKLGKEI